MNLSRWQQIEEIYTAALEIPAEKREHFLSIKCSQDESLRAEVESLLISIEECDDFLSEPDFELGLHLLTEPQHLLRAEQDFGNYKILNFLGSGGMGEVYLAEDLRLNRRVALKLLPPDLTSDKDRLRRFRQEARTASQIVHHNVAQIYEAGIAEDVHFIAMELVDGITLRERLKAPVPFDEVLIISEQIAAALAAAAEVGVVHRDLKPENVMLRRDKQVKVLDFGLAKLSPRYSALSSSPSAIEKIRENSQMVHTEPGLLMGTATYMSPEQARGLPVDNRGDLWSLGVILYEMLTGQPPFTGETKSDIIAAILRGEPVRIKTHSSYLPDDAERIIRKALQKNREERYQTAQEFAADLQRLRLQFNSVPDIEQRTNWNRISSRHFFKSTAQMRNSTVIEANSFSDRKVRGSEIKRYGIGLAAALLIFAGGSAFWKTAQPEPSNSLPFAATASRDGLQTVAFYDTKRKQGGSVGNLSFSPNGDRVAFMVSGEGKSVICVKSVNGESTMEITDGQAVDHHPVWSPDGRNIAFVSNRENKFGIWATSSVSLGKPVLLSLLDAPQSGNYELKKWSNDGRSLFYEHGGNLYQLDLETGQTKTVGSFVPDERRINFSISPNEQMIAFRSLSDEKWSLQVQPVAGGEAKSIVSGKHSQRDAMWFPDNRHLVYSSMEGGNSQIYIVDTESGSSAQITFSDSDLEFPIVSPDGSKIVFIAEKDEANVYSLNLKDKTEKAVTTNVNLQLFADVSASRHLVFQTTKGDIFNGQIKIKSLESKDEPRVVTKGGNPKLSPDGGSVAFMRNENGLINLWKIDASGENEKRLTSGGIAPGLFDRVPYSLKTNYYNWSADGKKLVYATAKPGNIRTVFANGSEEQQLTANTDANTKLHSPVWSPNGRRIAFVAATKSEKNASIIRYKVCLVENELEKTLFQIDAQDFRLLGWSADGSDVFAAYNNEFETATVLKISANAHQSAPLNNPLSLRAAYLHSIRLSPDGQRLAYAAQNDGRDNIFSISVNGGNARQLTANLDPSLYYSGLVWSPDGQMLFYSKQTSGLQISMITPKN